MTPNRSIRGAARIFKNILEFPKRYPNAQVFRIELNYRSVPEILESREQRDRSQRQNSSKRI